MTAARETSLQASLELFWDRFGKDYLIQSHAYYLFNLDHGCVKLTFEDFTKSSDSYDRTVRAMLDAFGARQEVREELVTMLARHDLRRHSAEALQANAHFTANKYGKDVPKQVQEGLLLIPEVLQLVEQHRQDLGY